MIFTWKGICCGLEDQNAYQTEATRTYICSLNKLFCYFFLVEPFICILQMELIIIRRMHFEIQYYRSLIWNHLLFGFCCRAGADVAVALFRVGAFKISTPSAKFLVSWAIIAAIIFKFQLCLVSNIYLLSLSDGNVFFPSSFETNFFPEKFSFSRQVSCSIILVWLLTIFNLWSCDVKSLFRKSENFQIQY